jgi:hypothetical protein
MFNKLLVLSIILTFLSITRSPLKAESPWVRGKVSLGLTKDIFQMPKEIYGIYISYPKDSEKLFQIDSFMVNLFKTPESRWTEETKVMSKDRTERCLPEAYGKLMVETDLCPGLFPLFKKYGVYLIKRIDRLFAYEDTIPHLVHTIGRGDIMQKDPNLNLHLTLFCDKNADVEEFGKELNKLDCSKGSGPVGHIIEFEVPNDYWWHDDSPTFNQDYYMGGTKMNFRNAWDVIKGNNQDPSLPEVRIAFVDGDFTNLTSNQDISPNVIYHQPYIGTATGHGTKTASIACAVTNGPNGNYGIAGATWNAKIMPFLATDMREVAEQLLSIRDNYQHNNFSWKTWVVNMSIGQDSSLFDPDTWLILDWLTKSLVDTYYIFIAAAVSDVSGGYSNIVWPAAFPDVIGVAAMKKNDTGLWEDSNWGDDVELVATGESVFTVDPLYFQDHETLSGTSAACPFVSSLLALMKMTEQWYDEDKASVVDKIKSTSKQFQEHNKTFYRINAQGALDAPVPLGSDFISVTGPTALLENQAYTFNSSLYDGYPYGDMINTGWNYTLEAYTTTPNVMDTLADGYEYFGPYTSSWAVTIPNMNENGDWLYDGRGYVRANVTVAAGTYPSSEWLVTPYHVGIDLPPRTPTNLAISLDPLNRPILHWHPNMEADIKHYEIWRRVLGIDPSYSVKGTTGDTSYTDQEVTYNPKLGNTVYYKIRAVDSSDFVSNFSNIVNTHGIVSAPWPPKWSEAIPNLTLIPNEIMLFSNYPNPFNPSTSIPFGLPNDNWVEINIYSITGEKVVCLTNQVIPKGYHYITWDGLNQNGNRVSSGVYIYELKAGDKRLINKMLLTK